MLTVSVLAKESDSTVHAVRHYTRIGLLHPKRNRNNGYKIYNDRDINLLKFINNAKELGFTLKEISTILDEADNGNSPCPTVRKIITKHIEENRWKIKQFKELQKKMIKAKTKWDEMEDALPNGHSVCHLIESFAENSI
jgi:DNA-binding transcriptional MerR regulator